jgi:hypothetical protein
MRPSTRTSKIETVHGAFCREQVENTIRINFIGTLNVRRLLFPLALLNLHARVVHVTPMTGGIRLIPNESLRNKFRKPDFESELVALVQRFVDLSKT